MPFDTTQFQRQQLTAREETVAVPGLADFFPDGEKAEFRVRSLTGEELARANQAVETARNLSAIAEGLAGGSKEVAEAVRRAAGVSADLPPDLVKRIELLLAGLVEPRLERDAVLKLAQHHPVDFYAVSNAVLRLTGQGSQPGKPRGSGGSQPSGPPSDSATSGDGSSTK